MGVQSHQGRGGSRLCVENPLVGRKFDCRMAVLKSSTRAYSPSLAAIWGLLRATAECWSWCSLTRFDFDRERRRISRRSSTRTDRKRQKQSGGGFRVTMVYLLQSLRDESRYYVGSTDHLPLRIAEHNSGSSVHTAKFRPWRLVVSVHFEEPHKAFAFERYLKSGSGRGFAKRHF